MAALCGKVYAIGGFDGSQRIYSIEVYDPFHNCWTEVSVFLYCLSFSPVHNLAYSLNVALSSVTNHILFTEVRVKFLLVVKRY